MINAVRAGFSSMLAYCGHSRVRRHGSLWPSAGKDSEDWKR